MSGAPSKSRDSSARERKRRGTRRDSDRFARMKKAGRFLAVSLVGGAGIYVAASWLAGRLLARHLISAEGLVPATAERQALLAALARAGGRVEDLRHAGSFYDPVTLA